MRYLPSIEKLAGAKTIGILCNFPYDGDWAENSPTQTYFYKLVAKAHQEKFPLDKRPVYPGWRASTEKLAEYDKLSADIWMYRSALENRSNEEGKALWAKAQKKFGDKDHLTMVVEALLKKINKSKYKTLIAVSSCQDQEETEPLLKQLGFAELLRFTNPNTNREYQLILWVRHK